VIVCGGSGLYIHSLLYELDFFFFFRDRNLREELAKEAEEKGSGVLFEKLLEIDPTAADHVHPNNVKRVIRALERVYGEIESDGIRDFEKTLDAKKRRYNSRIIRFTGERAELYKRIEKRAEVFFENGLVDEVRKLLESGINRGSTAMQGIGYKEVAGALAGEYDMDEALLLVKQNTRRYAKRQETWFKRYTDAEIINTCNE
jgi:tRNA dimethylallyltransferase